ncbi:VOC family protein [Streptomyces collinus]|uniref:VOC family protein n=1 Tax=Streptomyces collinus TaxID=42684 RepID=UPI0033F168D9
MVFAIPEMTPEMEQFITGILGMELFTTLPAGRGPEAHFYRCNPRTHCLAYTIVPGHKGVHHLAIEGTHMDDVGRAWDLVQERELPITTTLGRHMPDTLISFYMRTPTGFDIECGAQGERLDDDYVQNTPATPEGWGHKFVGDGLPATVRPVVSEEHATSEEQLRSHGQRPSSPPTGRAGSPETPSTPPAAASSASNPLRRVPSLALSPKGSTTNIAAALRQTAREASDP